MKRIKVENANRYLLCDDEDYDKLRAFNWRLQGTSDSRRFKLRTWSAEANNYISPFAVIFGKQNRGGFSFTFRDRDVCNYQRYNLDWLKPGSPTKLIYGISISHCPLGSAILRPKRTDGRSAVCFTCLEEAYDAYYICLDIVSHTTYWKGWIRHEV